MALKKSVLDFSDGERIEVSVMVQEWSLIYRLKDAKLMVRGFNYRSETIEAMLAEGQDRSWQNFYGPGKSMTIKVIKVDTVKKDDNGAAHLFFVFVLMNGVSN